MLKLTVLMLLSFVASGEAAAGEPAAQARQAYASYRHPGLPPERHVVEIVKVSSYGGVRFVINGHAFMAASGACDGWTARDRVELVAGEWHGYCGTAVFRNLTRRRSCEVLCNGW